LIQVGEIMRIGGRESGLIANVHHHYNHHELLLLLRGRR